MKAGTNGRGGSLCGVGRVCCAYGRGDARAQAGRQTLDALGTAPELPLEDGDWSSRLGEATALRRHDRKQAAHDQANAKVLAAQRDLDRCKANACGLHKAATDIQIAARQHEVAATAADPQAVDLACDWEWAEHQYLNAEGAPCTSE